MPKELSVQLWTPCTADPNIIVNNAIGVTLTRRANSGPISGECFTVCEIKITGDDGNTLTIKLFSPYGMTELLPITVDSTE